MEFHSLCYPFSTEPEVHGSQEELEETLALEQRRELSVIGR